LEKRNIEGLIRKTIITFSLVIVKYGITQDKLLFMSFNSMNGKGALIDSWYNLKQREKSGRNMPEELQTLGTCT